MLQQTLPTLERIKSVNTGVDWLTITVKDPDARERVYLEWQRVKMMLEKQGHICDSWSFRGYARIGKMGNQKGQRYLYAIWKRGLYQLVAVCYARSECDTSGHPSDGQFGQTLAAPRRHSLHLATGQPRFRAKKLDIHNP